MNKNIYLILLAFAMILSVSAQSRQTYTINNNWKFHKGDVAINKSTTTNTLAPKSDSTWSQINIPHTWNNLDATDETKGYYRGISWYEKSIYVEANKNGEKSPTFIFFEGVNQVTDLFVNGKWVGQHKGGYTRFNFDVSSFLKYGQNNIFSVKVDNSHNTDIPPLSADFTFFGGIYRDVYLIKLQDIHFSMDAYGANGVYITTPEVSNEEAKVNIKCDISNKTVHNKRVKVVYRIIDKQGQIVLEKTKKHSINKGENKQTITENFIIKKPHLWSPNSPYLYNVITQIKDAKTNNLLDESMQPLGLRWFKFDPQDGFFLNGKYLKLIGTNRHQDYLKKGNALKDEMHMSDVRLLKEMGGNFLRIAHYPQDPTVLEMCDRLGILASVEIPIVNAITESEKFSKNCLFMTEEMVKQNYNHPSLIIWAYMNEVLLRLPFNPKTEKERYKEYTNNVTKLASEIDSHIRKLDPYRYTMIPNHAAISRYKEAGLTTIPMILGWNLYQGWYVGVFAGFDKNLDELHQLFPNQSLIITEYGADVHAQLHSFESERFDYTVEYGNKYHEHYLEAIMSRPFISGANIWNLNDFYSETRGYAKPNTNLKGITTLDREKKDTWWLYKTFLSNQPIIKFGQNKWKIRGGVADINKSYCTQPVTIYSNGKSVQLLHNSTVYNAQVVNNLARFTVPFLNGKNQLIAKTMINSKEYIDIMDIDFRLAPNVFSEFKDDFYELNILLGSNRLYEDRVNSQIWIPEQKYTAGSWGYIGGEPFRPKTKNGSLPSSDLDIKNSEDDPIYQTQRIGIEKFKFDVPNGKYTISLHWAELQPNKNPEKLIYNLGDDRLLDDITDRIFNVSINGNYIENNLNLKEQFGAEKAISKKYTIIVSKGQGISIDFETKKGKPILNAIQIRKIL